MSVAEFYAAVMWTLGFWAYGEDYTIVPKRHVGLDIGTRRRAIDVPALIGGRVVIVTKTRSMAWVVVLDTGMPGPRRYHSYCHLSAVNLPRPGSWIEQGERVGKLAAGARNYDDPEFPGTAWGGIHLHLVMCDISFGAYTLNTGATFANPEIVIRETLGGLAASSSSRPFVAPIPVKEHTMRTIRWNERHVFTLGEQQVTHLDNVKYAINAAIIHNPDGKYVELDDDGLTTALLTFGVPWSAVDACMRGLAYDITGAVGGRFWARSVEQKIDTSRLAQSIEDLRRAAADLPGPSPVR